MNARHFNAFTLVELLVVLGIVAFVVSAFGLTRGSSGSVALEVAQKTVASILSAAHREAVVTENRVTLVIDANPAEDGFLRAIHVAVETSPDSGQWRLTETSALLPRGVYVVPSDANLNGVAMPASWPLTRRSSVSVAAPNSIVDDEENGGGQLLWLDTAFSPVGAERGVGGKLVVGEGRPTGTTVKFVHPERVRGLTLSAYGVPIAINDATGFDY